MKKEDFCFTIGFTGETAIVDKRARARYSGMNVKQLMEEGLYKAALCSALFDDSKEDQDYVLGEFRRVSGQSLSSVEDLKKIFGVMTVPEHIRAVKAV
jgi:hypothetical protein